MIAVSAAPRLGGPEAGVLGAPQAPPSGPVTTHRARGPRGSCHPHLGQVRAPSQPLAGNSTPNEETRTFRFVGGSF